jgi:hypothetical protein
VPFTLTRRLATLRLSAIHVLHIAKAQANCVAAFYKGRHYDLDIVGQVRRFPGAVSLTMRWRCCVSNRVGGSDSRLNASPRFGM